MCRPRCHQPSRGSRRTDERAPEEMSGNAQGELEVQEPDVFEVGKHKPAMREREQRVEKSKPLKHK